MTRDQAPADHQKVMEKLILILRKNNNNPWYYALPACFCEDPPALLVDDLDDWCGFCDQCMLIECVAEFSQNTGLYALAHEITEIVHSIERLAAYAAEIEASEPGEEIDMPPELYSVETAATKLMTIELRFDGVHRRVPRQAS